MKKYLILALAISFMVCFSVSAEIETELKDLRAQEQRIEQMKTMISSLFILAEKSDQKETIENALNEALTKIESIKKRIDNRIKEKEKEIEKKRRDDKKKQEEKEENYLNQSGQWIIPVDVKASGYTEWAETWYTGPPKFAIDDNEITKWTLNDMGEIVFDLGETKNIKGIEAYWNGSVSNGNTVNIFIDGNLILTEEQFGSTRNIRKFDSLPGRYIKYQTVAQPHNEFLQIATWSEINEFKVLVEN